MLLAFLLATYSLSFKGGSVADLTAAVLKDTKVPIVTPADIDNLPSFYMEYDKPEEVTEFLCRKFTLEQVKGVKNAFAPTILPSSYLQNNSSLMPSPDLALVADSKPCIEQKDGKWRLVPSPKGYFQLGYLESLKMSKPIKVHWLVKTMFVSGQTDWLSEKDLLITLAACSFGTLVESEKRYEIELDPKRFKTAAINWASRNMRLSQNRTYHSYAEQVRWALTAEAFRLCPEAQIKLALASPDSSQRIVVVPGTVLDKTVKELVRVFYYPRPEERMSGLDPKYLEIIDTSQSVKVQFEPRRTCFAVFPCFGNGELHL